MDETISINMRLKYVHEMIRSALSNQLISLYELPEHNQFLKNKNIPTPQFNIVFQNFMSNQNNEYNKLHYEIIPIENRFYSLDETDITLVIYEGTDEIKLEVVYNKGFYTLEFINNLKDFFIRSLGEMTEIFV